MHAATASAPVAPPPAAAAAAAGVPVAAAAQSFGAFTLGPLQLALPMAALREVVPRTALQRLPCPAACVVGALTLRGTLLPVVDLRLVVGLDSSAPCDIVVVMVHRGRLLGLLADGVDGIFSGTPDGLHPMRLDGAAAAILDGGVQRADSGATISLLSPAGLAALPQVPMVDDPEHGRDAAVPAADGADGGDSGLAGALAVPVMLVRCGRVGLALDAMAVHATLSDLTIEPSVLSRRPGGGDCLGVIDYAGAKVPVLDLRAMCGLGAIDDVASAQAFVLRLADGMVALLVSEVLDVAGTRPDDLLQVPAFAQPRPGLFAGALPVTALGEAVSATARSLGLQYLVLDAAALKALPELSALSQTNTPGQSTAQAGTPGFAVTAADGSGLRAMLTYELGGETATPIEQVSEILPFQPEGAVFDGAGALLGMVVNRGRSIPVMCLSGLCGLPPPRVGPAVSVLVVESGGQAVGFAVPMLRAIEPAQWEPDLANVQARAPATVAAVLGTRQLALVGHAGAGERMLRVIDLQRLAAALQAGAR